MRVLSSINAFREARRKMGSTVGFVPTMGYLHEGHLMLVRRAKAENETAVASIFVNPTQFGPKEDFARYPRDPERDLSLLEREGTDLVFMPDADEVYPQAFATWVGVEKVTERLEGSTRPGHFRGVATVVAKLFNIVEPTAAYFGEKDAQQVVVIKRMIADLNMNLNVVVVPTHREPDGLAMSSRNVYLNTEERQAALILWKSLSLARQLWSDQERRPEGIKQQMAALIQREPLARIDYISIADPETLEELAEIRHTALVSLAVHVGKTRLIDNITIT
jgi:pantoate--beta-alanine ligase